MEIARFANHPEACGESSVLDPRDRWLRRVLTKSVITEVHDPRAAGALKTQLWRAIFINLSRCMNLSRWVQVL